MSIYFKSEKTRKKMSEAKIGNVYSKGNRSDLTKKRLSESHTKKYSRITKKGKNRHGNQEYALVCDGVIIQKSTNIDKLKKHPIYNRKIDLTHYKCFDCIYYVGRNKCIPYKKTKYHPQCCVMFNFNQKFWRKLDSEI